MNKYDYINKLLLTKLSCFLNDNPCLITTNQINKLTKLGLNEPRAFSLLLQSFLELDRQNPNEEIIINEYFPLMINELKVSDYEHNPYYQNISFKAQKRHNWELKNTKYAAFEVFVCNDFKYLEDGRVIPQIGYFTKPFKYAAVYEKNHLWMSITPNEIETMKGPIARAFGNVVTIGLGMGYYAYMISLKDNVESITIVEKDPSIIKLFEEVILPKFEQKRKIKIIQMDAFEFLEYHLSNNYTYLFADIWHDVSDGKDLYLKIKNYEVRYPTIQFEYWIEKTLKYYL